MSDQIRLCAPIQFEMQISFTDGETTAKVTCSPGAGRIPKQEEVDAMIAKALAQVKEHSPHFRLKTKQEFWDEICEDKFGGVFALPGGDECDKPT